MEISTIDVSPPRASGRHRAGFRPNEPKLVVRRTDHRDITEDLIARWRDLEARSCYANAFLSPEFLLPAWKWLEPTNQSFLLTVEDHSSRRLVALGYFEESPSSRLLPLPHLAAARTMYTSRTGLLVDRESVATSLEVWLDYVRRHWSGIVLPNVPLDSLLVQHLQTTVVAAGLSWNAILPRTSAAVVRPSMFSEEFGNHLSAHRRGELCRKQRRIAEFGPVKLRRVGRPDEFSGALDQFLKLEDAGWKGAAGSSLLADQREADFFREMAAGFFQRDRMVLTQLHAGPHVVAASVNLLAGPTLFAFKIGWEPTFAKASPGQLQSYLLPRFVRQEFPGVMCIDSCARSGAFLDDLWPDRLSLADIVIPMSRFSQTAFTAVSAARNLKRTLTVWRRGTTVK